MKVKYYAIKDVKADEFGDLMFAKNDEVAKRLFGQIISKNPYLASDMQLYCIGDFENEDGSFVSTLNLVVDNVVEESKE